MSSKVLWIDTETTGVNPHRNALVQIGALVEIDGEVVEEIDINIQPLPTDEIDPKALARNKLTEDAISNFANPQIAYRDLIDHMSAYIDRYTKTDKFVAAGFNVKFDMDMLRGFFTKMNDKYFGSWFFWPTIDVVSFVAHHMACGLLLDLPNYQLETICKHFEIEYDAHDALADIRATRDLYLKIG